MKLYLSTDKNLSNLRTYHPSVNESSEELLTIYYCNMSMDHIHIVTHFKLQVLCSSSLKRLRQIFFLYMFTFICTIMPRHSNLNNYDSHNHDSYNNHHQSTHTGTTPTSENTKGLDSNQRQ